jgi:hypothetical protein
MNLEFQSSNPAAAEQEKKEKFLEIRLARHNGRQGIAASPSPHLSLNQRFYRKKTYFLHNILLPIVLQKIFICICEYEYKIL